MASSVQNGTKGGGIERWAGVWTGGGIMVIWTLECWGLGSVSLWAEVKCVKGLAR